MPLIRIRKGLFAEVSEEDSDLLGIAWHAHKHKNGTIYACHRYRVGGSTLRDWLHRVVMERMIGRRLQEDELVDHMDTNKLNCKRDNLRLATRSENESNKGYVYGRSKYRGVFFEEKRGMWRARITVNKKKYHLGYFKSEKEAAQAYNDAAIEHFREFATLNEL